MKKLNLNIDYKRTKEDVAQISNIELTISYLHFAVNSFYKEMQGQMLRTWGRLQRKLDDASEKKSKSIDIEDAEYDLVNKASNEAKFPANLSKFIVVLQENLFEDVKKK